MPKLKVENLGEFDVPEGKRLVLALEDEALPAGERKKLQQRETHLLRAHGQTWLGELAPFLLESFRHENDLLRLARGWHRIYALGWINVYDDPPLSYGGLLTSAGVPKPSGQRGWGASPLRRRMTRSSRCC